MIPEAKPSTDELRAHSTFTIKRPGVPYQPIDRPDSHIPETTQSPPSLEVDVAMFIVPHRKTFDVQVSHDQRRLNLCPQIEHVTETIPRQFYKERVIAEFHLIKISHFPFL